MADRAQQQSDLLNGWKEIAEFLEVDKSTAQRWAKTRGLPVRYLPGPKSRVVASASDLDAWRLAGPAVAPPEPLDDGGNLATSAIGKHSAPVQPPTRRRWLGYAVAGCGGVGLTVLGIGAARLYFFRNQRPNAYRVEGATLIVSGVSGAELWRHTFEGQLSEEAYQSSQGPKKCIFSDVDGDGHTETLFSFIGRDVHSERSLYCFDSAGRVRWRFTPGRTVVDNLNRTWSPPYLITAFEVVDSRKSKTKSVVVSSVHNYSFPTQVALLDGKTGRLLSDYWHRGHLLHLAIADLDGDGEPEILLGGVNDALEHRQATLVVFDQHNLSGSSRNPQGKTYFQGLAPGTEKHVVFFPRTPINMEQEFNQVADVTVASGRIVVLVAESLVNDAGIYVTYELDYNLRPVAALISDRLQEKYSDWQKRGKLLKQSAEQIADGLNNTVKVI